MTERCYAFKELMEKETIFNHQLEYLLSVMMPGFEMRENPNDANGLANAIFGSLVPIFDLSQVLLDALKSAYAVNNTDPHCGEIFVKYSERLIAYSGFIVNQEQSLTLLLERMKKNKKVKEFIESCLASSDPRLTSRDLRSIFLLPFQHLCRYKLYLDRILKASQNHDEYPILKDAAIHTNASTQAVNQWHGEQVNLLKLREVHAKLDFSHYELQKTSAAGSIDIATPGRELCDERDVFGLKTSKIAFVQSTTAKPYHLFLFNDLIICTKKQQSVFSREIKYKVKKAYVINAYFKAALDQLQKQATDHPYRFTITYGKEDFRDKNLYAAQTQHALQEILKKLDQLSNKHQEHHEITTNACGICKIPTTTTRSTISRQCEKCLRKVCDKCFIVTHQPNMCVNCGQKQGIAPLPASLIPAYRAYRCVVAASVQTSDMLALNVGDELEVYYIVNQSWAFGRNVTQFGTVGVFHLGHCALDQSRDLGPKQNMALFAGIYSPQDISTPQATNMSFFPPPTPNNSGQSDALSRDSISGRISTSGMASPKHTFQKPLVIGDVLVVTAIAGAQDEWYFAHSLKTSKYGYVHCDELKIIPGTTIPSGGNM